METEFYKAFYHDGIRLFSYPLSSEADDTQLATMEILAHQRSCPLDEIKVFLEECAEKQWDFSRDCTYEKLENQSGEQRWRILNVTNGKMYTHTGSLADFAAKYEAGMA